MDSRLEKVIDLVRGTYDSNGDPSHDFAHILRVLNTCKSIGLKSGADLTILLPAALLHDVINVPKNHPDRLRASEMAAQEAAGILKSVGYSDDEIKKISVVIHEHSYSLGKTPSCLESAIMQDADRLDALGAVGIMRAVTCAAKMGTPRYYHPTEMIASTRALDDRTYAIDHFFVKLFKLVEKMNTEEGRLEAKRRGEFMNQFLTQLKGEVSV